MKTTNLRMPVPLYVKLPFGQKEVNGVGLKPGNNTPFKSCQNWSYTGFERSLLGFESLPGLSITVSHLTFVGQNYQMSGVVSDVGQTFSHFDLTFL